MHNPTTPLFMIDLHCAVERKKCFLSIWSIRCTFSKELSFGTTPPALEAIGVETHSVMDHAHQNLVILRVRILPGVQSVQWIANMQWDCQYAMQMITFRCAAMSHIVNPCQLSRKVDIAALQEYTLRCFLSILRRCSSMTCGRMGGTEWTHAGGQICTTMTTSKACAFYYSAWELVRKVCILCSDGLMMDFPTTRCWHLPRLVMQSGARQFSEDKIIKTIIVHADQLRHWSQLYVHIHLDCRSYPCVNA